MNFVIFQDLQLKKETKECQHIQTDRSNIAKKTYDVWMWVFSLSVIHYSLCLLDRCPLQHSNRHIAVCLSGSILTYDASTPATSGRRWPMIFRSGGGRKVKRQESSVCPEPHISLLTKNPTTHSLITLDTEPNNPSVHFCSKALKIWSVAKHPHL